MAADRAQEVEVREHRFEDDGSIPNNSNLPLLVYPRALAEPEQETSRCKELLAGNGWGGAWVGGGPTLPFDRNKSVVRVWPICNPGSL